MKSIITSIGIMLTALMASASDWPQFRGQGSDGITEDSRPPLTWSETENIKWKIEIPGRGHSSPVVKNGLIYITTAVEENVRKERYSQNICFHADRITLFAICIDAETGRTKWNTELFKVDKPQPVHTLNSFATPTPSVDDSHLFCDFGDYGTACLDRMSGNIIWKKRLRVEHDVGPGSSTILYDDKLILLRDGCDFRYITALKKKDGSEVWKTDRPPVTGQRAEMHKSFSSPIVFESKGRAQLVAPCAQWIVSYDPDTGKEFWRANHGKGFSLAAQPTKANGMVYYCTGFSGNSVLAVKHNGSGDVTETHKAWESKKFAPSIPSPIVLKDRIYWIQDSGVFCCSDALTGKFHWKHKLSGKFLSAPISAGGRIYLTNQAGETTVVQLGDEFRSLAVNRLSEGEILATPAFVNKAIFLRTGKSLYRIEE